MLTAAIWLAWFSMLDIIRYASFKYEISRTITRAIWTTAAFLATAAANR